jgi:hypothetical protein
VGISRLGHGDADADRQDDLSVAGHDWLPERLQDPLGRGRGLGRAGHLVEQHGELIATEARHRVTLSDNADQPGGDRAQDVVTDPVAEAVVDELEPVDVEEQHRLHRAGVPAPGAGVLESVEEQRSGR